MLYSKSRVRPTIRQLLHGHLPNRETQRRDQCTATTAPTQTILQIEDALGEAMRTGLLYKNSLNLPPANPACCHPLQM